ncbi:MAG: WYL domain-containing protein [Clostridia bacterium]|nr:WYL domain-containing protein [Clostridia bacterium]
MASELIKNYEKIRDYMREFYIYGFKHRDEYTGKSSRSYDYEKHRIESYLSNFMSASRTLDGKSVYLSIDSRDIASNPLFASLKSKSFTDNDIILHFFILDLLHSPDVSLTHKEILEGINLRLAGSSKSVTELFDESTLRKKLKDYEAQGILVSEKSGKTVKYKRPTDLSLNTLYDAIAFFSEVSPLGALGFFMLERDEWQSSPFAFKHHYLTSALDSDILLLCLDSIRRRLQITVKTQSRGKEERQMDVVPLKIFSSAQNGRMHLMAYDLKLQKMVPLRIDYIKSVKQGNACEFYDALLEQFEKMRGHIWGVSMKKNINATERVEFTVFVDNGEEYIYKRLFREKRCGVVEMVDESHARFCAYIYDSQEIVPWIRTFITRITDISFQNKAVERQFLEDFERTLKLYDQGGVPQ